MCMQLGIYKWVPRRASGQPRSYDQVAVNSLVVPGDSGHVCLTGFRQGTRTGGHGPHVSEAFAIAISVSSNAAVALEKVYDVIDEAVDFALVSARGEASGVVHTSELSDPERLAIASVVVEVSLDTCHAVFVDVDVSIIVWGANLVGEVLEPGLRHLLAHGRADEFGALALEGGDVLFPVLNTLRHRHASRSSAGGAVWLLKADHVLRSLCYLLEGCKTRGVGTVSIPATPEHGDGHDATVRVGIRRPIVIPANMLA